MQSGNDRDSANDADGGTAEARQIRRRIMELQVEHRDLDVAIAQLGEQSGRDELQMRRLKKRKLVIKDMISRLEMGLVPDIPA